MPDRPTPLANALVAALTGPTVHTDGLIDKVRSQLSGGVVGAVASHMPVRSGMLAGAPPPPPPPVVAAPVAPPPTVAPPVVAPAVVPPPVVAPSIAAAPVVSPPAGPGPGASPIPPGADRIPDDAQMSEVDRRKVQGALQRLGYYALLVDGVFGPETRAGIRRYQHELGAEMTGRLTADQATRLVATH